MSRRGFLKTGMLAFAGCLCPNILMGAVGRALPPERSLSFYNIHTGESLKTVYWSEGGYVPEALSDINHTLRDFRTGEIKPIDTGLLDLLHALRKSLESRDTLHIISGYRSPGTNADLRENRHAVSGKSLHMQGKAADISLPRRSLKSLHKASVALQAGGVGYYPDPGFVHVDIGRVRYW